MVFITFMKASFLLLTLDFKSLNDILHKFNFHLFHKIQGVTFLKTHTNQILGSQITFSD